MKTLKPGALLRCREAARILDVSTRHIYRLIHQGDLDAVRIGARQIRVTHDSLEALLQLYHDEYPAYPDGAGDLRSHNPNWTRRRPPASPKAPTP